MSTTLTPQEDRVIYVLRQLPPQAAKEVEDFAIFLAARAASWSYSDPTTVSRTLDLMAQDPFLRREVESISADFSEAEADGLEGY